jgi:ABC-type transport system involved in cytochrome c biogenesis permease subunit
MEPLSYLLFVAGTLTVLLSFCALVAREVGAYLPVRREALATVRAGGAASESSRDASLEGLGRYGGYLAALAALLLYGFAITRFLAAGRYPFSNMYDFSIGLAMGILTAYQLFDSRYHLRGLGVAVLPVPAGLLLYAASLSPTIRPLTPSLQAPELFPLHVSVAVLAYSCFAVAFGAAVVHLAQLRLRSPLLPRLDESDEVGFLAASLGFASLTLVLTLGAFWANEAWGRHWAWDPKESAALVTWLLYAAYLHTHALPAWVCR